MARKIEEGKSLKTRIYTWFTVKKIILIAVLTVVFVVGGMIYSKYTHYYGLLQQLPTHSQQATTQVEREVSKEELLREKLEREERLSDLKQEDIMNILVIGVDSRENTFEGRSDAMIVVSINKQTKKILMTSLLRDIYVQIPNFQSNKLNAAYAQGGTDLLKTTIKNNFDIQVDRCIVINFHFVSDLVDALAGIDIEVTKEELKIMNHYIHDQNVESFHADPQKDQLDENKAGRLHLNGNQALAYSRNRYIGDDFERTNRQRKVIVKSIDKMKKLTLTELDRLAEKMLPKIATDLSQNDLATLMLVLLQMNRYQIQTMAIPIEGTYQELRINGMSSIGIDFEKNKTAWKEAVSEDVSKSKMQSSKEIHEGLKKNQIQTTKENDEVEHKQENERKKNEKEIKENKK